ncbi:hypothetical protein N825_21825 [Skermanella stibiiresistens SB22]|uniref:Glycosyl transferase family 1 n=1 Tax=Skermanella stibiiresistens SB22 TaxID=1385369 RepID=W9H020_9PROT|nr:glycosyltransferase [Skermanella stibiiresistens]EWY37088.1 hypothetical protein N825_21825 [Skermanella stibiiresistens SB22]
MTLLFASGTPHLPQVFGGLEINTHEMALELNQRGHRTAILSKLSLCDGFGVIRLVANHIRRAEISTDMGLGYQVYRSRRPWSQLSGLPMPRLVVVQNGNMVEIGKAFARRGVPVIAYFHGLEFELGRNRWMGEGKDLPFRAYIANSRFTAARFKERFGIDAHVIPPVFRPERYRAAGQRRCVTFINPVAEKGLELALALAASCPEIPFRFIKGWPLGPKDLLNLRRRLSRLPNVELAERSSDMLPVYGSTSILLAPSQWQAETWGRVASEAQFSGIPVLASNRGGLPEAVGPGGTILDAEAAPEVWAAELRRLWHDKDYHAAKSEAALAHSRRPEIDIDRQIESFLTIVDTVA